MAKLKVQMEKSREGEKRALSANYIFSTTTARTRGGKAQFWVKAA